MRGGSRAALFKPLSHLQSFTTCSPLCPRRTDLQGTDIRPVSTEGIDATGHFDIAATLLPRRGKKSLFFSRLNNYGSACPWLQIMAAGCAPTAGIDEENICLTFRNKFHFHD